ncbi:exosortase/archaeosortase family protein [Fontisphaera persica]|uniref:exosortase/archaeosortase family protein n=1 Tax=Fontisphaera persica TaxID=2974023 RepID=UPI0024C065D4|nr:exosortase/archaeosortase family protein [Fontisphaera persica]WCJ57990.1 exosortase/archaeosortase family protein [Fontisphaera persica]
MSSNASLAMPPSPAAPWPTLLLLGAVWLWVCLMLAPEWEINPQYSYGWGVPFLALYLFGRRWPPGPPQPPAARHWRWGLAALLALCLPLQLVYEANPDWRLVTWLAAWVAVAVSLITLWGVGGAGWAWHMAFPVLFMLTAVPWPTALETRVVNGLLSLITAVTTEALNWLGVAAFRQGNIIKLASGLSVGVNEACSGVRSLQTSVMVALFMGEWFRLRGGGRAGLLLAGMGWAMLLNMLRTGWLAWLTARHGAAAQQQWHDAAGLVLFLLLVAGVAALGYGLRRKATSPESKSSLAEVAGAAWLPKGCALGLCVWLMACWALTEAWYRWHERERGPRLVWSVRWPVEAPGFRMRAVEEEIRVLLRSTRSESALWERGDGTHWILFFNRWEPSRVSSLMARVHRPEICLPATGFELVERHPPALFPAGPLELPFRTYVFTGQGRTWYVFFCVMEERPLGGPASVEHEPTRGQRLRQAWLGRRNLGQQALEAVLTGYPSLAEAQRAWLTELPRLIVTEE